MRDVPRGLHSLLYEKEQVTPSRRSSWIAPFLRQNLNHPIIYSSGDHTALSQYSITAAVATPLPKRFRLLLYCGYCIFIGVSDYY